MAFYDFVPKDINGSDLTAAPYSSVRFNPELWPAVSADRQPIAATVPGVGDKLIRTQPLATICEVFCDFVDGLQATLDAFATDFDDEADLVFLQAADGDGKLWRVAMQTLRLERISPLRWKAIQYVPDPVWEENAEASSSAPEWDAMSGAGAKSKAVTNAGNRKTDPILVIAPQAGGVKDADPGDRFLEVRPGIINNRSPEGLNNYPINVLDVAGADATLDTAALIRDTSISNQANGGETDSATTIDVDTAVGGGLPAVGGFCWNEATGEQIYYAANSGTQLTGCVRGVGGTTPAAIADNQVLDNSKMLKDGSDIRCFWDGREVERWLGAFDSALTRIWINVSLPPAVALTLTAAIDASQTTGIAFDEGVEDLPDFGFLTNGEELIGYLGRDIPNREPTGIVRSVGPVAGAAAAAAATFWGNTHRLHVAWGRYGLGAAPEPEARRPTFDLALSHNQRRIWGQASEPQKFFDPDNPTRPQGWRPDPSVAAGRVDESSPLAWTASDRKQMTMKLTDQDAPDDDHIFSNRFTVDLPVPIKDGSSAIQANILPNPFMIIRFLGRGIHGREDIAYEEWDDDDLQSVHAQSITSTGLYYGLTLEFIRAFAQGHWSVDGAAYWKLTENANHVEVKFRVAESIELMGLGTYLWAAGVAGFEADARFTANLYFDDDDALGTLLIEFLESTAGSADSAGEFNPSDLRTTSKSFNAFYNKQNGVIRPFILNPGWYWFKLLVSGTGDIGEEIGLGAGPITDEGRSAGIVDTTSLPGGGGNIPFLTLIHTGKGPIRKISDRIILRANSSFDPAGEIDDVDITLDPAKAPLVQTKASHYGNSYEFLTLLTNTATGETLTLGIMGDVGDSLEIDCKEKTVKQTDPDGWIFDASHGVRASNIARWFALAAGANTIDYLEGGSLNNTDFTVKQRGRKAV